MPVQPHEGFLVSRTLMVCAPPAVGGMGSAGLLALTLLLHELQLILVDFLLCITGMHYGSYVATHKHGLRYKYGIMRYRTCI